MPDLTAIVPATDGPPTLARALAAIRAATDAPEQIIAVERPPHAGPARARNEGAMDAGGEILVFVDADVVVAEDAFERIRAAFSSDAELVALFGSYDDTPDAAGVVSTFRNLLHHHVHQQAAGPAQTFWAGLGAIRRTAFLEAGGFDAERYPLPSVEDIELGTRLAAGGARIVLDPLLVGTHLKAWTLASMIRTDFSRRGVPWVALLLERGGASTALNLGWRHRATAAAVLAATAALLARRPALALAAAAVVVALNRSFYSLLVRRMGAPAAAAGVGLHAIHHVVAVAAVPAGIGVHLLASRASGRRR